ncbi:MAG: OmpA family protein [Acetobacteraceae bacterium]|nr:OmpA family protein [Acetobacteraceae bacterium]
MALTGVEQIAITSQPSGDRVLNELLTTLQQSPELSVGLVGHRDSAGAGAHDQELPDRRAASVYLWLMQGGIGRDRLRSRGRGFLEPITTKTTPGRGKRFDRPGLSLSCCMEWKRQTPFCQSNGGGLGTWVTDPVACPGRGALCWAQVAAM